MLTRELEENREKLVAQAQAFERTVGDLLGLRLLPKTDVFQFFRVLANLDKEIATAQTLRHDSHVDFYMTSSATAPHREGLRVGHQNVEVLSLRETPSETFPDVFRDLLKLECNFILVSEFRRLINDDAITKIRSSQSHHYWNQWISDPMALLNLILSFGKKDDLVADESETDDVDELTQTLKRVKNGGEYLGEFSFTVVLFAEHNRAKLQTTAADVVKIFGAHEGALIQESYKALNAYLSIVPGNDKEYWAVNWTGNLAHVKPAKEKARTNINLVTQAGHVYSFIATEVSGTPTPADLKLFVTPTDNTALVTLRDKPRFVPAADLEKEKKRADDAEARLAGQQADAHKEIAKERVEALATVTAKIEHDYKFKFTGTHEPFNLTAMYHDDRFTYIEATPTEPPAIYEVKDGKDSLIQFEFDEAHHRYTIPKVDQGYLRVGKTSLKFKREKAG